jgi:hypothetical protein
MADTQMRTMTPTSLHRPAGGAPPVSETLQHTVSEVTSAAGQIKEKVQDAASTVAHRVEDAWDSAATGVREGARAVTDTAEDFWAGTTRTIRRYPVASVLIAFGLGCLCASLFRVPHWSDDMTRRMSRSSA